MAEEKVTQKTYKLNFNVVVTDLDGQEVQELRPGLNNKTGVKVSDLTDADFVPQKLNKILARSMATDNEDFDGRIYEWYEVLYRTGVLELSEIDTNLIKGFIEKKKKAENGGYTNILMFQFKKVFKAAKFDW